MADTVTLTQQIVATATEILDAASVANAATADGRTLRSDALNVTQSLSGSTTPPVNNVVQLNLAGTGAAQTINLTAAPKSAGRTADLSGKKLVALILKAPAANVSAVTIAPGAANPYPPFGAGKSILLDPGEVLQKTFLKDKATAKPAVAGAVKNIDITIAVGDTLAALLIFD